MDPKEWNAKLAEVVFMTASAKLTPPLAGDESALRQIVPPLEPSPFGELYSLSEFLLQFFLVTGVFLPGSSKIAPSKHLCLRACPLTGTLDMGLELTNWLGGPLGTSGLTRAGQVLDMARVNRVVPGMARPKLESPIP